MQAICLKTIVNAADFACIQLVYGYSGKLLNFCYIRICVSCLRVLGDGKTHYIKSQLKRMRSSVTIAVNEAFTPLKAISRLHSLPLEKDKCGIYFNFTILHPKVCETTDNYKECMHMFLSVIQASYIDKQLA